MGSLAFHQMQENEFTQSQSSQGESPYQRDAFMSFYLFILGGWGGGVGQEHFESRETFLAAWQHLLH